MTVRREMLLADLALASLGLNPPSLVAGQPFPESGTLSPSQSGNELVDIEYEEFNTGTHVMVMGVGGDGCQTVRYMLDQQIRGIEFACIDTDLTALADHAECRVIQLGFHSLSSVGQPLVGKEGTQGPAHKICAALKNVALLFIVAGLGGDTGAGAALVIAELAQKMGILTVGIVTLPFEFEGQSRIANAQACLTELRANTSTLCVMPAEKLADTLSKDATPAQAFDHFNTLVKNALGGIATAVHGLNVVSEEQRDFLEVQWCDVFSNLYEPGQTMLVTAVAIGAERALLAAEQIIASPWLSPRELAHAKGLIVLCAGAKDGLQAWESKLVMNTLRAAVSPEAHLLRFTIHDESLVNEIRVTVIVTGLPTLGTSNFD